MEVKVCFKKVSRVFEKRLKGIIRKIKGCLKEVCSGFQGYMKEENFREISKVVQGSFKGVPRKFQGLKGFFKKVSRVFYWKLSGF